MPPRKSKKGRTKPIAATATWVAHRHCGHTDLSHGPSRGAPARPGRTSKRTLAVSRHCPFVRPRAWTQLVVGLQGEEGKGIRAPGACETPCGHPNLFRQPRAYLADDPPAVPRQGLRSGGRQSVPGHDMASIRAARPKRRCRPSRRGDCNEPCRRAAFKVGCQPGVAVSQLYGFEPDPDLHRSSAVTRRVPLAAMPQIYTRWPKVLASRWPPISQPRAEPSRSGPAQREDTGAAQQRYPRPAHAIWAPGPSPGFTRPQPGTDARAPGWPRHGKPRRLPR